MRTFNDCIHRQKSSWAIYKIPLVFDELSCSLYHASLHPFSFCARSKCAHPPSFRSLLCSSLSSSPRGAQGTTWLSARHSEAQEALAAPSEERSTTQPMRPGSSPLFFQRAFFGSLPRLVPRLQRMDILPSAGGAVVLSSQMGSVHGKRQLSKV